MLDFNNYGELWWSSIAGPNSYLRAVCEQIYEKNSVLAVISSAFPYRWEFRDAVANEFSTNLSIEYVDCAEELQDSKDPGAGIVKIMNATKLSDYIRCWEDKDRFKILKDIPGMDKDLIWVRSIPADQVNQWLDFLQRYLSYSEHKGVFLLELISDEAVPDRLPQTIGVIDYASRVSPADLRLFTSMIASGLYPEQEQEYVSALSATLCRKDPEVAAKLLENGDLCKTSVISKLEEIRKQFDTSSYGFTRGWDDPAHPFSLLDKEDYHTLENRIWTAQLRIAFPVIEMERQSLIVKYETSLRDALAHPYSGSKHEKAQWIESVTGERITDPYDLEVGSLYLMTKVDRYDAQCTRYWQGITLEDRRRISYLRDRRNNLAHLHVVEADDFLPLLYPEKTP